MLAASISATTDEPDRSASSSTIVPATFGKRPFTVENIMCLTASSTTEWAGSMVQVLVPRVDEAAEVGEDIGVLLLVLGWDRGGTVRFVRVAGDALAVR